MLGATRRLHIEQIAAREGQVQVSDLARRFAVSEETIRRDLLHLEQEGVLQRNYGGAVLKQAPRGSALLPPVEERQTVHQFEKERIGRLAASLVTEGQVVMLDAGSTTRQVARFLQTIPHLTVITHDLAICDELRSAEGVRVIVTGGYLKPRSRSVIGPEAVAALRRYHADVLFLGASGICLDTGLTVSDVFEAEIKTAMLHQATRSVLVADHSKFGRKHLATLTPANGVHTLVTDWQAPDDAVRGLRVLGVEVLVAENQD